MSGLADIVLDEKIETTIKKPSKYDVIMLNDDKTPMNWVVEILTLIFKHDPKTSHEIMEKIHNQGSAVVGTYYYEVAEQKATETISLSRQQGFPLKVKIEEQS